MLRHLTLLLPLCLPAVAEGQDVPPDSLLAAAERLAQRIEREGVADPYGPGHEAFRLLRTAPQADDTLARQLQRDLALYLLEGAEPWISLPKTLWMYRADEQVDARPLTIIMAVVDSAAVARWDSLGEVVWKEPTLERGADTVVSFRVYIARAHRVGRLASITYTFSRRNPGGGPMPGRGGYATGGTFILILTADGWRLALRDLWIT